jgi:ferredoxin
MKIFYFTATGNSLAVAKRIGGEGSELISIAQVLKLQGHPSYEGDAIGVIFPTYGCSVPRIVEKFLQKTTFRADYLFAVQTYGANRGTACRDLQRLMEGKPKRFDYIGGVLMLDNCQPQFDIAKQREGLPKKDVEGQMVRLKKDISERRRFIPKNNLTDKLLRWVSKTFFSYFEKPDFAERNFGVNEEECILCGTCAKVCPAANVIIGAHVTFADHCANCQACVHACPKHAIHTRGERNTERWRNPEVKLVEIIRANNQNQEKHS